MNLRRFVACALWSSCVLVHLSAAAPASGLYVAYSDGVTGDFSGVLRYDQSGALQGRLPTTGVFNWSIAKNAAGDVFLAQFIGGAISRFNSLGEPLGDFATPTATLAPGMAVNSQQDLLVAISGEANAYIERFSSTGSSRGVFATTAGHGGIITDLTIDSAGNLYAAIRNEVQRFDASGRLTQRFFMPTSPHARSVAVDSAGNVYALHVLELEDPAEIYKFDANGNSLGIVITNEGYLTSIAIDRNDVLYAGGGKINASEGFVKKFSKTGELLRTPISGFPGIAADLAIISNPEPTSAVLVVPALVAMIHRGRRRAL